VTPIHLERNIWKATWTRDVKFGTQLCVGNAVRAQIIPLKVGVA